MEEIGRVQLRNEYEIYEVRLGYEVVSRDRRGQAFTQHVSSEIVEQCAKSLAGKAWRVDEAAKFLEPLAAEHDWPFVFGYKLRFFVQSTMLVLVALGRAELEQEGRAFIYSFY